MQAGRNSRRTEWNQTRLVGSDQPIWAPFCKNPLGRDRKRSKPKYRGINSPYNHYAIATPKADPQREAQVVYFQIFSFIEVSVARRRQHVWRHGVPRMTSASGPAAIPGLVRDVEHVARRRDADEPDRSGCLRPCICVARDDRWGPHV